MYQYLSIHLHLEALLTQCVASSLHTYFHFPNVQLRSLSLLATLADLHHMSLQGC